ncbi:MAG TPA: hypothetical protein VFK12_03335 [Gammaproteobacteria bacterium]|jgi:hypothetical protein|nr:hypothetical protein [Gammaproteobacteria bacterium]
MADQGNETKFEFDLDNLYREEVFTDQKVGTLRQMTPVKKDGSADNTRPILFVGETSLLTPAGTLPVNFRIEAETLTDAFGKFTAAANQAIQETMEQLRELRRQAASSIVVPELGKGGGLGGLGGGGKIQIP